MPSQAATPNTGEQQPAARRRNARRVQILDAAWELARRDGLAAISLRELADRVDMRQPSLYWYFPSKAALYDAMFAQGFAQLVDERERLRLPRDPIAALRAGCRHFLEFCVREPVRYQLLFQPSVPGFEPSAESMRVAEAALGYLARWLAAAGAPDRDALDLMRALLLGLAGEQIANEPGGKRWIKFADRIVDVVIETPRRHRA
ncbi:MAG TPA: TetR/AcrR family transcriptional regulator [Jatrophihabitantaceae bacterium]|nr:TetR/AcrR family transcriptional regulator [Jatrophihabitantaceae bacterium]